MGAQLWTEKYRPRKYTDLIFNGDIHHDALSWLREYPAHGRVLLLNGPPGVGKTTLVHVLASVLGFNLVEFNASNDTNYIERILELSGTVNMKRNLVLVDEIDNNPSLSIERLVSAANLVHPVILTSNDTQLKDVYTLNVKKPDFNEIRRGIEKVCQEENMQIDSSVLSKIVDHSGNDFRAIINYLQVCGKKILTNKTYWKIEKHVPLNQYKVVESLLSRYMGWREYEEVYTSNVLSLCHGSFLHNTGVLRCATDIIESTSVADILPCEYKYICLSKYNNCNSRKVEIEKGEYYKECKRSSVVEYILPYFKRYDLSKSDRRSLEHLRKIVGTYNIKDVVIREEEVVNCIKTKPTGKFRFRYKNGHSSATRRNITVKEILN